MTRSLFIHMCAATVAALAIAAPHGASALSLDVGASVGSGGIDADVSASVGDVGASASASVGGSASVGAGVSVGGTSTPGTTAATATSVAPGAIPGQSAQPIPLRLVGMLVISSDSKPIGYVSDVETGAEGYLVRVSLLETLHAPVATVLLKYNREPKANEALRLRQSLANFLAQL